MLLNQLFETTSHSTPNKVSVINADNGEQLTLKELNDRSNQLSNYFHSIGLVAGDTITILMGNNIHYIEVCRAALRSGLYFTTINNHLKPDEAAYIINDCEAKVLITCDAEVELSNAITEQTPLVNHRLLIGEKTEGYIHYQECRDSFPTQARESQYNGDQMLYSSGTTGRPKGIKREISGADVEPLMVKVAKLHGYSVDTRYLSPAPLYHSGPLGVIMSITSMGGSVVIMPKFDPEWCLQLMEQHQINFGQFVPTMFIRMLRLPEEVRNKYSFPALKKVLHTSSPCAIEVKKQMIDWWGPILYEVYGATEAHGLTAIDAKDWLEHPGSVGQANLGILHICDDDGNELAPGETGLIYFERDHLPFVYHNDSKKTREAQHPDHPFWTTVGDVGYVDEEGYLYLTDRKSFMIISGGVNIYPQAIEDCLCVHPKVYDVAVIGVPHQEMGEEVKAIVQLRQDIEPSSALEEELINYTREHLAHYMCPRSVDFVEHLPRLPTGKLYKKQLRDAYLDT